MGRKMRLLTTGAALALAVQMAPAAVAAEAREAACGVSGANLDQRPNGQYFQQPVSIRTGPAWECRVFDTATTRNAVDYYCTTDGFTYLRTKARVRGWVWNGYLVDGGTNVQCQG